MKGPVPTVGKQVHSVSVFSQTVGTAAMAPAPRLSAKMKALPGTNEPYEVSSQ